LPSVDDIAVQDEFLAGMVSEEVDCLAYPGVLNAQVDIGQHDGFIVCFQRNGFDKCAYQVFP
jgi:hypothetical protein